MRRGRVERKLCGVALQQYFGVDGRTTTEDWRYSVLDVAPPMVVAFVVGAIDGVGGLAGLLLVLGYLVVCRVLWTPLLLRMGVRPPRQPDV